LKLINFVFLNDAQNMLMYGIYQMEHSTTISFHKKFLRNENDSRGCFDIFSNETGAINQFKIIKKLYEKLMI
jgi:hypothetical protein